MSSRLELLFVSHYPASPPTFGAQRRIEGLMRALGRRHRVSFVGLAPPSFDREVSERAMRAYCDEVVLVPWPVATGAAKRLAQLRSLLSLHSYQRMHMNNPALQRALDRILTARRFDLVSVEEPFMAYSNLRQAPDGRAAPRLLIDAHNIEFDLARQYGEMSKGAMRRIHHFVNWRKLRREEIGAWHGVDGVAFTSVDDEARAKNLFPGIHSAVIPNGVDTHQFAPQKDLPQADGRTIVFFGTMNYFPNMDAVRWLLKEIWPQLARRHPEARLKIIGSHPIPEAIAAAGPRVEIAGLVNDLQHHLAEAAAIVVPLRIGGGTRLKILESLAMGKAVVSTRLGAEGIVATSGEHLLIADRPEELVDSLIRVLEDPALTQRIGEKGRALVEDRYSWAAIGDRMEGFIEELLEHRTV